MKDPAFDACFNAIMAARLEAPIVYAPFTVYFDRQKLDNIRDYYGVDLFRACYAAAQKEVTL